MAKRINDTEAQNVDEPQILNRGTKNSTRVLFLGYSQLETGVLDKLIDDGCEVWHTKGEIKSTEGYDLVISFGYRHILNKDAIQSSPAPIINLHISYLPYNRGAHPNFWSFCDATPSGVSIHLIDQGIDTGPIIYQKLVNFSENEKTFAQTYNLLVEEVESLFAKNMDAILSNSYIAKDQRHIGTFHKTEDLPEEFGGWDAEIESEIARLDEILKDQAESKLKLIDEIENIRTNNNVNWMDLLRLAFKVAPDEAKRIVQKINQDDNRISELFSKLGK